MNWKRPQRLPRHFKKMKFACEAVRLDVNEIVDRFYGHEEQVGSAFVSQKARIKQGLTQEEAARAD